MRCILLPLLIACVGPLSAQRSDTLYFGNKDYKFMVRQSTKPSKWSGSISYYDQNGAIKRTVPYKNGKFDGDAVEYYDNGQVRAIQPFRKGRLNGEIRTYYRNGNIEWTKPYRKGKLYGERVLRDSTGAFANGDNVEELPWGHAQVASHCVNGRPEGKVVVTQDGKVSYIGNYRNGLPDGDYIYYNGDGTPIRKDIYKNGRFVESDELNW